MPPTPDYSLYFVEHFFRDEGFVYPLIPIATTNRKLKVSVVKGVIQYAQNVTRAVMLIVRRPEIEIKLQPEHYFSSTPPVNYFLKHCLHNVTASRIDLDKTFSVFSHFRSIPSGWR